MTGQIRPTAIVTGASRGIGRAIALALAKEGFDLVGVATKLDPSKPQLGLLEVAGLAEQHGAKFVPVKADIAVPAQHADIVEAALEHFGRIDLLVNNAGRAPQVRCDVLDTTPESFDRVWAVNTKGTFFLTQRIARQMIDRPPHPAGHPASIIFISSISAEVSSPSRAEYCLSKAAISQAARIFAHRLAEHEINVYEVRPGIIQTDMTAAVAQQYDQLFAAGLAPQARWGQPQDVAKAGGLAGSR